MAYLGPRSRIGRCLILVNTFIVLAACKGQQGAPLVSEQETIARHYVFAACLMQRYAGTPVADEADTWAQGLVEAGNLPGDAYPALAAFASRAPEVAQSQNGTEMRMQSCMALHDDPQVAAEVRKLVQR